ncbi:hypothetical protein C8R43DRAFT_384220 [Mycena crocata]|nr:hypothetical protein C8R43DRAFT_384220 [Mycena crocata]
MASLQTLPPEIIEAICHYWPPGLDAVCIVRLQQVSRQFSHILKQSSALQYKIQLQLAGLRDGPSKQHLPESAARIAALAAYKSAWERFSLTPTTVKMSGHLWELVGNVLATYSPEDGFFFYRIPSATRHVNSSEWSIADVPVGHVRDFTMDFSQDLLLVVEIDSSRAAVLHLLSLQTGRPHPSASKSCLSHNIDLPHLSPPQSFQLRIFSQHVGVMAQTEENETELVVWDWKSGSLKRHFIEDDMTSFAFLDNRRLLVTCVDDNAQPQLRVVEIEGHVRDMSGYFSFLLPDITDRFGDSSDIDVMIQTEPAPSWTADNHPEEPFTISHHDRLFVVSLHEWGVFGAAGPTFMLCFLLSTLVDMMENRPPGTKDRTAVWNKWGPANTRMLKVPRLPDPWVCYVYGQRCIIQTKSRCQILDFNPLSTSDKRITHQKTVDERQKLFLEPVTTWAPFTLHSVDISPCSAVMLQEDAIITVSEEEDLFTILSV